MRHRTALVVSGIVTAFVMVAVIGLFGLSARLGANAQAAPAANTAGVTAFDGSGQLSTDVATLQAEVVAYQQQLDQAYQALQQAYGEIQVLSGGSQGFRGGRGPGRLQFFDEGGGND